MAVFVEVHVVAKPEDEEQHAHDGADEDYPRCVFDAGDVGFVLSGFLAGLNGGLLSFHDSIIAFLNVINWFTLE